MKKPLKPAHSAGGLSSQGKVLLYILSEPLLFYLRPIVFCAIILCREDPNFIPSVTFLTGARALLQVPSSHLFSRQKLDLFLQSLLTGLVLQTPINFETLCRNLPQFFVVSLVFVAGVCVFWMWSDEYCRGQLSLLSAGHCPAHQPRKPLAFAHVQLHTHQHFPLAASPQSPACIVYSFPSAGQGFCSC